MGDQVRYRDCDTADWKFGVVTAVGPPVEVAGETTRKSNNYGTVETWRYAEKITGVSMVCIKHFAGANKTAGS